MQNLQSLVQSLSATSNLMSRFYCSRKFLKFAASRLKGIPLAKYTLALRAEHEIRQFPLFFCSKGEVRRHFACRAYEDDRSVPRFHSRKMIFNHECYPPNRFTPPPWSSISSKSPLSSRYRFFQRYSGARSLAFAGTNARP